MAWKGRKPILPTPYWYNTPIEDLDFEWSPEEKLQIERHCEKILRNIEEEGGMTPLERFNAAMFGGDKDRVCVSVFGSNTYPVRVLDGFGGSLKPIDLYNHPKLWALAHLAFIARFGQDIGSWHAVNYGEDLWGGQSRMIEFGNPIMEGEPPIKTMEDLEGIVVPDPLKDGLYPGYLWAYGETRRIFDEYKIPHPLWGSICVGVTLTPQMCMLGMEGFSRALRRDKELVKKCCDLALEWLIKYGKIFIDRVRPDGIYT